jgi:hypothetical protein
MTTSQDRPMPAMRISKDADAPRSNPSPSFIQDRPGAGVAAARPNA